MPRGRQTACHACFPQGLGILGFDCRHSAPITERAACRGAETPLLSPGLCGPVGVRWAHPILSLPHARSHTGSAVDLRFSLSTAAPGLRRRFSLREESAKVRGASPGRWGHLGRVPGSSFTAGWRVVQILPCPPPRASDSCSPGRTGPRQLQQLRSPSLLVPGAHRSVCTCAWVCRRVFGRGWGQNGIGTRSETMLWSVGRWRDGRVASRPWDGTWSFLRCCCEISPSLRRSREGRRLIAAWPGMVDLLS